MLVWSLIGFTRSFHVSQTQCFVHWWTLVPGVLQPFIKNRSWTTENTHLLFLVLCVLLVLSLNTTVYPDPLFLLVKVISLFLLVFRNVDMFKSRSTTPLILLVLSLTKKDVMGNTKKDRANFSDLTLHKCYHTEGNDIETWELQVQQWSNDSTHDILFTGIQICLVNVTLHLFYSLVRSVMLSLLLLKHQCWYDPWRWWRVPEKLWRCCSSQGSRIKKYQLYLVKIERTRIMSMGKEHPKSLFALISFFIGTTFNPRLWSIRLKMEQDRTFGMPAWVTKLMMQWQL